MMSSRRMSVGPMSRITQVRVMLGALCLMDVVGCGRGASGTSGSGGDSGSAGSAGTGGGSGTGGATGSGGGPTGSGAAGAGDHRFRWHVGKRGRWRGRGGTGGTSGERGVAPVGVVAVVGSGGHGREGRRGTGGAGGGPAACSEMPIRIAPPAGKEAFRYDPIDTRFFRSPVTGWAFSARIRGSSVKSRWRISIGTGTWILRRGRRGIFLGS